MMTPTEFQQEKAQLVERLGETAKEGSHKWAQGFAKLYARSGWTHRELAAAEHLSQQRITQLLNFGRFLIFLTTSGSHVKEPGERQYRTLWVGSDKTRTEQQRFAAILATLDQSTEATGPAPSRHAVRRLSQQIIAHFADGKWHQLRAMVEAVEADNATVKSLLDRMVEQGTFRIYAEKRPTSHGSFSYRLVKGGKKKIDMTAFKAESEGIVDEMWTYCTGHLVSFDQTTMRLLVAKLKQMIDKMAR